MANFKVKYFGVISLQIGSPDKAILKSAIKIGTQNVRNMYESGKLHNIIQRMNMNISGMSDTRWSNRGQQHTINGTTTFRAMTILITVIDSQEV